jgi:hypothetical protein
MSAVRSSPRRLRCTIALSAAIVVATLAASSGAWARDDAGVLAFATQGQRSNLMDLRPLAQPRPVADLPAPVVLPAAPRGALPTIGEPAALRGEVALVRGMTVRGEGLRAVCVRTCDGYFFPVGDLPRGSSTLAHETACQAACPGAPTQLFTLARNEQDMSKARNLEGATYGEQPFAFLHERTRVAACGCGTGNRPLLSLRRDLTLRAGDAVATADSALILTPDRSENGWSFVDFRVARVAQPQQRALDARVGTMQREANARVIRQQMRVREARGPLVDLRTLSDATAPQRLGDGGLRVVLASPYADSAVTSRR